MPKRDPFPMSSPQAKQLAGAAGEAETSWSAMGTETEVSGPKGDSTDVEASQGLVGGGSKSASGDIYADVEKDDDDDDEDAFFDRPLNESRRSATERGVMRALEKVYKRLYGDKLTPAEMLRTLVLASTLFFMIGGYWLLRSLKDPVLTALCGVSVIPKAKMLSVFVVLAVVTVYNKLLDSSIPKHKLFYLFGTFYFSMFVAIAFALMHPTIGLANEQPDPSRILGWISYCTIESFGSVMVSLFWSFANSNISLETAKASYGVMVATAQVGSIIGPTIVNKYAESLGVAKVYLCGALCMLLLQGTMFTYISVYGVKEDAKAASGKKKKAAGVLEGLKLFIEYNYVKGIFAISCLFMVEVTIVDYTMKVLARDFFADEHPCVMGMPCYAANGNHGLSQEATNAFTAFMGFFGQATNTLSLMLSLFGTSAVIRYLGLRLTLLLFPSICLAVIIFVRMNPTLYVVFGAMMTLKACSYALNNPTKELLYQPTNAAVKYKAKSWIDIFGARGSKALGSVVTNAFSDSAATLVANGSLVGMGVASFLIWNAHFMGKQFDKYTASGYIVGESMEEQFEETKNVEMASEQNDAPDTSCAIYDDTEVGAEEEGQEADKGDKADVKMV